MQQPLNLHTPVNGWEQKQLTLDGGQPATIGRVICEALVGPEMGLSDEESERRFAFAEKLRDLDEYELSSKELALVRTRIRMHFHAPGLTGPALRILEIKSTPTSPDDSAPAGHADAPPHRCA